MPDKTKPKAMVKIANIEKTTIKLKDFFIEKSNLNIFNVIK